LLIGFLSELNLGHITSDIYHCLSHKLESNQMHILAQGLKLEIAKKFGTHGHLLRQTNSLVVYFLQN
jgi:hypothetical protein